MDKRTSLAIKAAKTAGKVLLDNFKKVRKIESKGDRDYVTDIDLKAEKCIIDLIRAEFPDDDILSEENKYRVAAADYSWIIDPLDGTHNYIHNIQIFGTSIAVAFKGEVVTGVIYLPVVQEIYLAQRGRGAYCNEEPIKVSAREISQATMIYDSSIRYNKEPMLKGLSNVIDTVFNIRMFGSSAQHLADVASGRAEVDIEFNDKVWDFAAGLLLIEEAGGRCTDFAGQPWTLETKQYIASNGVVHDEVLRMLGLTRDSD